MKRKKWVVMCSTLIMVLASAFMAYGAQIHGTGKWANWCLDVQGLSSGAGKSAGKTVHVYKCHGKYNQQWRFTSKHEIRGTGKWANWCLALQGLSTGRAGKSVYLHKCNGRSNQNWSSSRGELRVEGLCLDIQGLSTGWAGKSVHAYRCNEGVNQTWQYKGEVKSSKGYYGNSIVIKKRYCGVADIMVYNPTVSRRPYKKLKPLVIKNQRQYEQFIRKIPKTIVSMTNPAPKSNDPLLKKPKINFKYYIMIVVFNSSISTSVEKISFTQNGQLLDVAVRWKKPFMGAQPIDLGAYCAYIVDKHSKIKFN